VTKQIRAIAGTGSTGVDYPITSVPNATRCDRGGGSGWNDGLLNFECDDQERYRQLRGFLTDEIVRDLGIR